MTSYLAQRLLLMIPTFIGITLIGFLIMRLAPGDPAELRAAGGLGAAGGAGISLEKRGAVDEAMAQWRAQYGLDKPLHVQYLVWLQNLFTLKFGDSFKDSQPVWDKIAERLSVTIKLNVWSILVVYLVAIPLGIYSATHANSLGDQITTVVAFGLFAVPLVWAATMAIVFICGGDFYYLFPPGGVESLDFSEQWSLLEKNPGSRLAFVPACRFVVVQRIRRLIPLHAIEHAGGARPRLRSGGAREGTGEKGRYLQARAAQLLDPPGYAPGRHSPRPDRRQRYH